MRKMSLGQVAAITGGALHGNPQIVVHGVSTDTRTLQSGDLFCAIVGERVDAHTLVGEALAGGAVAALVSRPVSAPCVVVPEDADLDPVIIALGRLARIQRDLHMGTTVVGVTGSSGKTTTKDLIGQVLAHHGSTFAPAGSPNNELGLPLTILKAPDSVAFVVAEMGMRGVGHIAYLCGIARPTIGVVTNVGLAHVAEVGSIEAIARAKAELVMALPATGFAILNNDDERVRAMRFDAQAHVVTYGTREGSDVRADNVSVSSDGTTVFDLVHGQSRHVIALPLPGRHNVSNALAAAAVGITVGMTLLSVAEALEQLQQRSKWRMQTYEAPHGVTLINDAYNANPDSMAAAIATIASLPRRRWAVLGGMHELGDFAEEEHRRMGQLCVASGIDCVVGVGPLAEAVVRGARGARTAVWFPDIDGAANYLAARIEPGDVVLFKASRAEGLERLADAVAESLGGASA